MSELAVHINNPFSIYLESIQVGMLALEVSLISVCTFVRYDGSTPLGFDLLHLSCFCKLIHRTQLSSTQLSSTPRSHVDHHNLLRQVLKGSLPSPSRVCALQVYQVSHGIASRRVSDGWYIGSPFLSGD